MGLLKSFIQMLPIPNVNDWVVHSLRLKKWMSLNDMTDWSGNEFVPSGAGQFVLVGNNSDGLSCNLFNLGSLGSLVFGNFNSP